MARREREQVRRLHWTRRRVDAIAAMAGTLVLVAGMVVVRNGWVPGVERRVFRVINDLPGFLYPLFAPAQQLGVLVVGLLVAVVAVALRRYRLALAAVLVTGAKLVLERVVKAAVTRERPGTSIGADIHVRGDVSRAGESFVSGHAVLATALAMIIAPYLRGRWRLVPWLLAGAVAVGRVYVGAHNPLDVVCGAALGLGIGGCANLLVKVPNHQQPDGVDG